MSARLDYVVLIHNVIHFENKLAPAGLNQSDSVFAVLVNLGYNFEQSLVLTESSPLRRPRVGAFWDTRKKKKCHIISSVSHQNLNNGVDVRKTPRTQVGMCTSAEVEGGGAVWQSQRKRSSRCQSTSYETGRRWVQRLAFSIHHLKVRSSVQMNTFLQMSVWKRDGDGGVGGGKRLHRRQPLRIKKTQSYWTGLEADWLSCSRGLCTQESKQRKKDLVQP